jgi:hypothetical protein
MSYFDKMTNADIADMIRDVVDSEALNPYHDKLLREAAKRLESTETITEDDGK